METTETKKMELSSDAMIPELRIVKTIIGQYEIMEYYDRNTGELVFSKSKYIQ